MRGPSPRGGVSCGSASRPPPPRSTGRGTKVTGRGGRIRSPRREKCPRSTGGRKEETQRKRRGGKGARRACRHVARRSATATAGGSQATVAAENPESWENGYEGVVVPYTFPGVDWDALDACAGRAHRRRPWTRGARRPRDEPARRLPGQDGRRRRTLATSSTTRDVLALLAVHAIMLGAPPEQPASATHSALPAPPARTLVTPPGRRWSRARPLARAPRPRPVCGPGTWIVYLPLPTCCGCKRSVRADTARQAHDSPKETQRHA